MTVTEQEIKLAGFESVSTLRGFTGLQAAEVVIVPEVTKSHLLCNSSLNMSLWRITVGDTLLTPAHKARDKRSNSGKRNGEK